LLQSGFTAYESSKKVVFIINIDIPLAGYYGVADIEWYLLGQQRCIGVVTEAYEWKLKALEINIQTLGPWRFCAPSIASWSLSFTNIGRIHLTNNLTETP